MRRIRGGWIIFLLLYARVLKAQIADDALQLQAVSSGTYTRFHRDVFSFLPNPAALAGIKKFAIGIYGERRFMLPELNNYSAAIQVPVHPGNFGLTASYTGSSLYNESQLGIAYGISLGNNLELGARFNYFSFSQGESYGNFSKIGAVFGTLVHISGKVHTGFCIRYPFPAKYSFALGYEASEKFFWSVEISKEEEKLVNINSGFQYKPVDLLVLRAGILSATSSVYFGAGFIKKNIRMDIISGWHPQLGISPGLSLIFQPKPRDK